MPTTLDLTGASFEQVRDFFLDSTPNAVIGARENGDGGIELYRRDDLKGKEWFKDLFILAKTRQNNYEQARRLISQKASSTAWSNPLSGAAQTLGHILTQHHQNFHARDFIDLNNQVEARHDALKGLQRTFSELQMNKPQRNKFSDAIGLINSSVFAQVLCPAPGSVPRMEKIENAFDHFKNFVKSSLGRTDSPVSIDFVAVLNLTKELEPVLREKDSADAWGNMPFEKTLGKQLLGVFSNITLARDSKLANAHTIKRSDLPSKANIPKYDRWVLKHMPADFIAVKLVKLESEDLTVSQTKGNEKSTRNQEAYVLLENGIKALRTYYDGKSAGKVGVDFDAIWALKNQITRILLLESTKTLVQNPESNAARDIKSLCAHLDIPYPYT